MASADRQPSRYASARDLPSFVEMEQNLRAMTVWSLVKRGLRPQIRELEAQVISMADTVDAFYRILGPRNWVFTNSLSVEKVKQLVASHENDPAEAERALIAHQDDTLDFWVQRLAHRPGLRERYYLLELALADYQAERYAAAIHLVMSVMDGYVNDVTRQDRRRRGLHAQSGQDMEAWDSVVSHTQGLARIHEEVFTKPFYNLVSEEVTDLYRNGIVHGTVTNFDNQIVAAKAWNYLFAVVDWADAREKAAVEPEPQPSFRQALRIFGDIAENRKHIDAWEPRTLRPGDPGFEADAAYVRSVEFFELWTCCNWGHISAMTTRIGGGTAIATPKEVKEEYSPLALDFWEIHEVRHEAAAIAIVEGTISIKGDVHRATLRWVHEDGEGNVRVETQDGEWRLVWWGPAAFTDRADDK